jgi:signal transduction histidine kinase
VLALAALGWISSAVLDLEQEKEIAQHQAQESNTIRLALWRMDAWLAPRLAQEAARPYFEYLSFVPNDRAYTRLLNRIEAGEVLNPSPLLDFDSDFFPLHFQLDENNVWSSPQVPTGNQLDLASGVHVTEQALRQKRELFNQVQSSISSAGMLVGMNCVEGGFRKQLAAMLETDGASIERQELSKRVQSNIAAQNDVNFRNDDSNWVAPKKAQLEPVYNGMQQIFDYSPDPQVVSVGPLLPIWVGQPATPTAVEIYFLRKVEVGDMLLLQGFVCNWDRLQTSLLEQVEDLYAGSDIQLVRGDIEDVENAGEMLAAVPARLVVSSQALQRASGWTAARVTLALGWFAVLAGLVGCAFSLHASITYGEKRSRFASSVTHELRTPLTTFRMYTEMLVKGMVGEGKRLEYLQTLQRESDRLSVLVENVLAYARIEDGRAPLTRDPILVSELVNRSSAALKQRVLDAGHHLEIQNQVPDEVQVETDCGAVDQVLFNLVDNACKYGHQGGVAEISLTVKRESGKLWILVRDQGPGVPTNVAKAIFRAFDRGAVEAADPNPGIGLGLALCRGLAQDLGGGLDLQHADEGGACFGFWLPLA